MPQRKTSTRQKKPLKCDREKFFAAALPAMIGTYIGVNQIFSASAHMLEVRRTALRDTFFQDSATPWAGSRIRGE